MHRGNVLSGPDSYNSEPNMHHMTFPTLIRYVSMNVCDIALLDHGTKEGFESETTSRPEARHFPVPTTCGRVAIDTQNRT